MPTIDNRTARFERALAELESAARSNRERSRELERRARYLRRHLGRGDNLIDLVEHEPSPRMVEMLSTNMTALETAGAEFRVAEALALRAEGLSITAIAVLFGVTRQRISALLKQKTATSPWS